MKKGQAKYPRIEALGIRIHRTDNTAWVTWRDIHAALDRRGLSREKFGEYFGVQTQLVEGPFPGDVEAVLERMMSGTKTGTQKFWD